MRIPQRNVSNTVANSTLLVVSLCLLATGCNPPPPSPSTAVRPVKTMLVSAWEKAHIRSFPGTVEASRRAELAFQVSGLLVQLPVREGQQVKRDEVLAQLREDEFRARLQSLEGQLDQARASLDAARAGERPEERQRREANVRAAAARLANAHAEFERHTQLLPARAISRAEFDRAETAYRVAQEEHQAALRLLEQGTVARDEDIQALEAEVRGLEGRVVEASIQLNDCTLRAPYNGVIAQRFVEEGQNIRATEPILRFQDANEIEIVVDVPESVMISDLRTADIISMTAELNSVPGIDFPVHIREMAQVADPVTQTFRIRVAMAPPDGIQVLPGMTASVTANYRRAEILGNRILVPISAVHRTDSGEQIVWVLGSDLTVSPRRVALGAVTGSQIEIVSGLEPGDRIATAGVSFLRDGMQVRDLGDALGG